MAGSVCKVILIDEYKSGSSLTELAKRHNVSVATVRYHVSRAGVLRSRADGVRQAAANGKLGSGLRGKSRVFTEAHKKAISRGRSEWGAKHALGVSIKPSGYREHTRGKHKGKSEHVVNMERRLGRDLKPDEVVHHIDGNRQNNDDNNLALVTRSGHARLHRFEDAMSGKSRERKSNGRFS